MLRLDGVSVLFVDDHKDVRESMEMMLTSRGAKFSSAASAHEARERLRLYRPHVVVSDVRMPREDGVQLLKSVRRLSNDAFDVPFIALSAYAKPQDVAKATEAGFAAFLPKPTTGDEMARSITRIVEAHANSARVRPRRSKASEERVDPIGQNLRARRDAARKSSIEERGGQGRPQPHARSMQLALLTFRHAGNGSVSVESPGGRIVATFTRIPLDGKDEWYVRGAPGGLPEGEARRVFSEWNAGGKRCDEA